MAAAARLQTPGAPAARRPQRWPVWTRDDARAAPTAAGAAAWAGAAAADSPPQRLQALAAALLIALFATPACAAAALLPQPVRDALRAAGLPDDALSVLAVPPGRFSRGAIAQQADRPVQPGSTMKLVTSVVALDRLGPNHRGSTDLLTTVPLQGAVLAGDLVLRGGADAELGLPQLWQLLAELRWQGVQTIAGNIVLDRTLFRPARPELGLPPFDETPEFPYNVVPDALQLAGSLVGLELRADAAAVQARLVPPLDEIDIDNRLLPADRACKDWDDDWRTPQQLAPLAAAVPSTAAQPPAGAVLPAPASTSLLPAVQSAMVATAPTAPAADVSATSATSTTAAPATPRSVAALTAAPAAAGAPSRIRLLLQGSFPRNCLQRVELQLLDRNVQAERQLRLVWQSLGGNWRGSVRDGATPAGAQLVARHTARPWGELLRQQNKQSDNVLSRLLFLSLGLRWMAAEPDATTQALAARDVLRWFDEHRIDSRGLVLDNGSGLSRSERITPRQLVRLLQEAQTGRYASELMMSLPVAGVDGTMRNRLKTSPAAGRARLKSGTLRNVTAVAGYVPDAQGRLWVVAAIVNHEQAVRGRPVLDALVDWIARSGTSGADGRNGGVGPRGDGP